jgi:hypothetical protein
VGVPCRAVLLQHFLGGVVREFDLQVTKRDVVLRRLVEAATTTI